MEERCSLNNDRECKAILKTKRLCSSVLRRATIERTNYGKGNHEIEKTWQSWALTCKSPPSRPKGYDSSRFTWEHSDRQGITESGATPSRT